MEEASIVSESDLVNTTDIALDARRSVLLSHVAPINRLPMELVSTIFMNVDEREPVHSSDQVQPPLFVPRDWTQPIHQAWLGNRLVCKQWDRILCDSPSLWKDIYATRGTGGIDWLELSLKHARDTIPVDVTLGRLKLARLKEALKLLGPHSRHLRMLSFVCALGGEPAKVVAAFLETCTAVLEELRLDGFHFRALIQHYSDNDLHMPSLQALRLIEVTVIPRPCAFTNHLRILDLRGSLSDLPAWSFDTLLDLLDSCKDTLEELTLHQLVPNVDRSALVRTISLPRLKLLVLRPVLDTAIDIYRRITPFWGCLRVPLSASVTLTDRSNVLFVYAVPRHSAETFPILLHATSARLFVKKKCWFSCTEPGGGTLSVWARRYSAFSSAGRHGCQLEGHLEDLCEVLARAPLDALTLIMPEDDRVPSAYAIAKVFRAFPALKSIDLVTEGEGPNVSVTVLVRDTSVILPGFPEDIDTFSDSDSYL